MVIHFRQVLWATIISLFQYQAISSSLISSDLGKLEKFAHIGPADFECLSNDKFPHETQCELFYECINGTSSLKPCPVQFQFLFNVQTSICDFAYEVHCGDRERPTNYPPTLEPPLTTTKIPTTVSLTTISVTSTKIPSTTSTSKPTVSTSTSSPTTSPPSHVFNCTVNGAFAHPKYCELYYDCWMGSATLLKCPKSKEGHEQLFDTEYSGCKTASLTDCGDRQRPTPLFVCPDKEDAYYVDPFNCAGFFRCVEGESSHYLCPPDLYFNIELSVCDFPANVDCADRFMLL